MSDRLGSSRLQALFETALRNYQQETGITLAEHPLTKQLEDCYSVDSIITFLQTQAQTFVEFREGHRIPTSIKTTVLALNGLSAAVDAVGLPFSPAKAIHAGLSVLLSAANGVTASYDALIDLLESIEHFLKRLDIYTKIPSSSALDEIVVKVLVELLSTLALATNEVKQGRTKKYVKKLIGVGGTDIEAALQRLDRLTTDEARTTGAETLKVVYSLVENMNGKSSSDSIQQALEMLHTVAGGMNKLKRDKLQTDIRRWLSPPDPWKNQNVASEKWHEMTVMWFIRGDTFSEWKTSGAGSVLWVHGKPGAGKSVLCSKIVQDINAMNKLGLVSLVFFYHDFSEDQKRGIRGLLSSALSQLCDQSDAYYDILSTFYSTHHDGAQTASNGELAGCLKRMLKFPGQAPIFLIIDALDECPNTSKMPSHREEVLDFIEKLMDWQLPNLRVCVTSRPEADIKAVFEPFIFRSISLHEERGQMEDIENYIKSFVNTNRDMRKWKPEHKERVIEVLTKRADGMFRWVYCQLHYLYRSKPASIERVLADLPETLDDTYARTLREISKTDREHAHRLLQFVVVALRPLRVEELAELLAFDFQSHPIPTFDEGWRTPDPLEAVLSTCSSLLAVVVVEGSPVIQFSHYSVKEFLTSTRLAESDDQVLCHYHVSMTPAHTFAAQSCLGMLLYLDENHTRDSVQKLPLTEYAAEHWVDHARIKDVSQIVEDGMKELFDASQHHLATWVWMYNPRLCRLISQRPQMPWQLKGTPLHYAAACGLCDVVKSLVIEQPEDVRSRRFNDKLTPLHLASEKGYVEVACMLLDGGADATAWDRYGRTALHLAIRSGHVEVAHMLIKRGADTEAQDEHGQTALHLASERGHVEVARILVERSVDVTVRDVNGRTALHLASAGGHVDVVVMLVERGADATIPDMIGQTALQLASAGGHAGVARILVECSANATALSEDQDKDRRIALHLASEMGHMEVVRILIKHGADTTAQDMTGRTALHLALERGHTEIARMLVECNADATTRKQTALHVAPENGDVEGAPMLVKRGEDMTVQDEHERIALHLASKSGDMEFVRMLLERGADSAARDEYGQTALHLASAGGHAEVAYVLVKRGADTTARDEHEQTALHLASERGHMEVTRMLIEHGADAMAEDDHKQTPLHLASERGHEDVARRLIEHRASVTAQDKYGWTSLHLASVEGQVEVACMLIEHGADVTIQDMYGWTAMHLAAARGHTEVVRILVERGVDKTVQDNQGQTAFDLASAGGHVEVTRLLERGMTVMCQVEDGQTTTEPGHTEISRIPDERGVDMTAQDKHGQTDFHLASTGALMATHTLVVRQDEDGPTQTERGHVEVVGTSARDMHEQTVPHLASAGLGHVEAARTTVERGVGAIAAEEERTRGLRRIWNNLRAHLCSFC